ncbi:MAG: CBS domain-containing protein [Methanomassiliicoccales archaeon]|nr:CBS domain-containing protein [Methanomassiliicoccales archaeon]MDD1755792.1 CBS domain-containing protein [Methanomassiliicoccales archaeon]
MEMMGENIEAMKKRELLRSQIDSIGLSSLMDEKFETVDPEMVLTDVVAKMRAKNLHEMPVTENGKKLIGVISYRSIIRRKNLVIGTKVRSAMDLPPDISPDTMITKVAEQFLSTGYRQMPVLKGSKIVGIISRSDIAGIIPKIKDLKAIKVQNIMTRQVQTAQEDEPIKNAIETMRKLDIRTLPVVDGEGRLTGIIGIRDIVNYNWNGGRRETKGEISGEKNPVEVKVGSLASEAVVTISPEATLNDAVKLMSSKKVSALPVVEKEEMVGIVTLYDVVELIASFGQRDMVYMQITGLEEEDRFSLDVMEREIQNGLAKIAKITRPQLFTMHVTKHHGAGNRSKYSLSARLFTANGAFIASSVDWSLIKATVDLMNVFDAKVMGMKEERLDKKKRSRREP